MIEHKHLIVRAEVRRPPVSPKEVMSWFRDLIDALGMKILSGPHAEYVLKEGNRGVTCVCIIETSHVAMHVWDERDPALMQLDVYTCGRLDPMLIVSELQIFDPIKVECKHLDREHGLREV